MMRKNIPNFFTLLNLFCGCIAIVFAFEGALTWSVYLVGMACVCDFLDGLAARTLGVSSEIGKQLDSLADVVSFGVVPGVVMFRMIKSALAYEHISNLQFGSLPDFGNLWTESMLPAFSLPFIAFLIPVFSAVRLAKFNIDTRQSDSFIGLPTPANAILITSFVLIEPVFSSHSIVDVLSGLFNGDIGLDAFSLEESGTTWMANPYFLIGLTIVSSLSLVAPIPLFALKFKNFSWADNSVRYIFLALALVLLIIFRMAGIPLIIVLYIVLSVINNLVSKK